MEQQLLWHQGQLAAFDLETTGPDPHTDHIVSASICRTDGQARNWLVDPGIEIPAGATAVHGITTDHARAHGRPAVESIVEIAAEIKAVAAGGAALVVYRAPFDLTLLRAELLRNGLPSPDWSELLVVDPYVLDRQCDRYRRGKRRLTDVCAHYGVTLERADAHTSAGDARSAMLLAQAIGRHYAELSVLPLAELHRAQAKWHASDAAGLQSYFRQRGSHEVVDPRWPVQCDDEFLI